SFFFQAEDGIRDYKVTGVQTCALPIFWTYDIAQDTPTQLTFSAPAITWVAWTRDGKHLAYGSNGSPNGLWWIRADGSGAPQKLRSEERRVGKECRCRWGRCQ